jgi:hypothetical protein
MRPAARLAIRLRPGLSPRPSSACAAARPGPAAGRHTRHSGLPWRSRAPSAAAGDAAATARCGPPQRPGNKAEPAEEPLYPAGRGCFRPGGSRGRDATLAHHVPHQPLMVLLHLGRGRRFGAQAPRHQPEASSACPLRQGPLPAPGGPVPGPGSSLDHNGSDRVHPPAHRRGPGPRPGRTYRPAVSGPCGHHQPSRHCRPSRACVPLRAAGVRPVHLHKAASLRSGRNRPVTRGGHGAVRLCLDALLLAQRAAAERARGAVSVAYVAKTF